MEQQSMLTPDLQINPDAAARSAEHQSALDIARLLKERRFHEEEVHFGKLSPERAQAQAFEAYWDAQARKSR